MTYPCVECGKSTEVLDTRETTIEPFGKTLRRRRVCPKGHRFSTAEILASSGKGQQFQPEVLAKMDAEMRQSIGKQLRTFANKFIKGKI